MPDPFKILGIDPERAKQGAAYAGTQALDLLYSPLYMKALGDALSSFMGSTPPRPQQEAPTPEAAPYQALTGALMEPLRRVGEEQSGRVAELEALYPQILQEALTGMRGLGEQYGEANPELGPILAVMQLFHGSPHRFNKFRHADEVARTGQGANSFGHGIYLAENPAVAQNYARELGRPTLSIRGSEYDLQYVAMNGLASSEKDTWRLRALARDLNDRAVDPSDPVAAYRRIAENARRQGADALAESNEEMANALKRMMDEGELEIRPGAHHYDVTGDFDPEDLLDWDAPLSEQSPAIQEKLNAALRLNHPSGAQSIDQLQPGTTGEQFYRLIGHGDKEQSSRVLNKVGIPGLRYLDQGSRAPHTIGAGKVLADQSTQVKRALGWDSDHPRSPIIEYLAQRNTSVPSYNYYQELRGKWRAANQKQRAEMLKGATVQDIMAHQYATNEPLVKEMERLGMRTRNVVWWGDPEKLQIKNPPE